MIDHYETLGISRDADAATIKSAYRRLAGIHHPDKGGDTETFQRISVAYAILSDPDKRAHYDRTGEDGAPERSEFQEMVPLVVGAFDRAVEAVLKSPSQWGAPKGLGSTDIVKSMLKLLGEDLDRGKLAMKSLDIEVDRMNEMLRRLGFTGEEGTNIVASMLNQRIRDAGEMRTKNERMIGLVEKTVEHVRLYGWRLDPAPPISGMWGDLYLRDFVMQPNLRMPIMAPDTKINITKPARRPFHVRLDADGKQQPPPRGSWAAMERRAAELAA